MLSGTAMEASQLLSEPIQVSVFAAEPNKKLLGPRFKGEQKAVVAAMEGLTNEEAEALQTELAANGKGDVKGFEITPELVTFKQTTKTVSEVKYTPHVIEPSFGIGRILHAVLEHAFSQRNGDEARCVMSFKPCVAPIKVGLFRLVNNSPALDVIVADIHDDFQDAGVVDKVDSSSGTIGRRYARADELGIPFGVTVDFDSLTSKSVTVRERDSMTQIRVPIARLVSLVSSLSAETVSWSTAMSRYPVVNDGGDAEEGEKKELRAQKALVVESTFRGAFSRPAVALATTSN